MSRGSLFRKEDDSLILSLMSDLRGTKYPFNVISRRLPKYTSKQISHHWSNFLDPELDHSPLSDDEKEFITRWISEHGKDGINWKILRAELKTKFCRSRSSNKIKNYWHSSLRQIDDKDTKILETDDKTDDGDLMDSMETDDETDNEDLIDLMDYEEKMDEEGFTDSSPPSFINEIPILANDMEKRPHVASILTSFHKAGFNLNDITPWVASLSNDVLGESSDEQMMWRWIEWKSDDADIYMIAGTAESSYNDVEQLVKWGLVLEAAEYLRHQFSLEAWCEYDLHSRMIWWIEEGRNNILGITPVTNTLYPVVNPPVDIWTGVNNNDSNSHFGVPTYYVSEKSLETLDYQYTNIIDQFSEIYANSYCDLKLFHATKWQYVPQVLNGIDIGYIPRRTDFSISRAFYTTTEFHTALCHCNNHNTDWRGCAAIIIFLLPSIRVMNPEYYINLEENWRRVVACCRNGVDPKKVKEVKGKWFVQGKQLQNVREVIDAYKINGINQAEKIAISHNPPRDQLAVIRDQGADILDSAFKGVIILPRRRY